MTNHDQHALKSKPTLPLHQTERISELDLIRGFALLGILIVNMQYFSYPFIYTTISNIDLWPDVWDQAVKKGIVIFAQNKFNTMFSFLFGLGFMIFIQRAKQKGEQPARLFIRRLLVLLGIGLIHSYFIWAGDVLVFYSIMGFILLLFRNCQPKTLLTWAFSLIFIPVVLLTLLIVLILATAGSASSASELMPLELGRTIINGSLFTYSQGTYAAIFAQNAADLNLVRIGYLSILPLFFAMFLFGAYAGKTEIFKNLAIHLSWIKKLWVCALVIGLAITLPAVFVSPEFMGRSVHGLFQHISYFVGGSALSLCYITSLILLTRKELWQRLLAPLQAVGRMAATNYLAQSIISTFIFYSYGLGLYGKVSPAWAMLVCAAIFSFQIVISNWWMKRFAYGPVEWVWRTLTYGKKPPFKQRRSRDISA
ncbi:DUF418 domain-containing protein [Paenibacillus sp. 481]|uniref:DUF418 domain-containing protein n=1 Tax=Paenibacillus sp. 481 TaxID=2835869 RepID=UPI001E3B5911|nr:DUF418 domain-containing protein [Paenibacillus sp. 481]UHA72224.1 DUF418 domain-containing protein [Paenibacillus sp. 481]